MRISSPCTSYLGVHHLTGQELRLQHEACILRKSRTTALAPPKRSPKGRTAKRVFDTFLRNTLYHCDQRLLALQVIQRSRSRKWFWGGLCRTLCNFYSISMREPVRQRVVPNLPFLPNNWWPTIIKLWIPLLFKRLHRVTPVTWPNPWRALETSSYTTFQSLYLHYFCCSRTFSPYDMVKRQMIIIWRRIPPLRYSCSSKENGTKLVTSHIFLQILTWAYLGRRRHWCIEKSKWRRNQAVDEGQMLVMETKYLCSDPFVVNQTFQWFWRNFVLFWRNKNGFFSCQRRNASTSLRRVNGLTFPKQGPACIKEFTHGKRVTPRNNYQLWVNLRALQRYR